MDGAPSLAGGDFLADLLEGFVLRVKTPNGPKQGILEEKAEIQSVQPWL